MKALLFSLLMLTLPVANAADRLTEDGIRALYDQLTAAAQARDVEGVARHMSEDARVRIKAADAGGDLDLDLPKYRELMQQGWNNLDGYQVNVTITQIDIAADGQSATVQDVTEERYQAQGQSAQSRTLGTATLRLVDGEPKVSRIDGVIQP